MPRGRARGRAPTMRGRVGAPHQQLRAFILCHQISWFDEATHARPCGGTSSQRIMERSASREAQQAFVRVAKDLSSSPSGPPEQWREGGGRNDDEPTTTTTTTSPSSRGSDRRSTAARRNDEGAAAASANTMPRISQARGKTQKGNLSQERQVSSIPIGSSNLPNHQVCIATTDEWRKAMRAGG